MPSVKYVICGETIEIGETGRLPVNRPLSQFSFVGDSLDSASEKVTAYVQNLFEDSWSLDDPSWEGDLGRIGNKPKPILIPYKERIEKITGKSYYIVRRMHVAVRVTQLSPPKCTIRLTNADLKPPPCSTAQAQDTENYDGGEWWL